MVLVHSEAGQLGVVRVTGGIWPTLHLVKDSPVTRPGSSAVAQKSWIPALGVVIALLVCIGLMVHVASIDGHTATAVSVAANADHQTMLSSGSAPVTSEMTSAVEALELCAFLGALCALMLLVVRQLSGLPFRSDRSSPRQSSQQLKTIAVASGGLVSRSALLVPLRV
jgi:hypothetical protein